MNLARVVAELEANNPSRRKQGRMDSVDTRAFPRSFDEAEKRFEADNSSIAGAARAGSGNNSAPLSLCTDLRDTVRTVTPNRNAAGSGGRGGAASAGASGTTGSGVGGHAAQSLSAESLSFLEDMLELVQTIRQNRTLTGHFVEKMRRCYKVHRALFKLTMKTSGSSNTGSNTSSGIVVERDCFAKKSRFVNSLAFHQRFCSAFCLQHDLVEVASVDGSAPAFESRYAGSSSGGMPGNHQETTGVPGLPASSSYHDPVFAANANSVGALLANSGAADPSVIAKSSQPGSRATRPSVSHLTRLKPWELTHVLDETFFCSSEQQILDKLAETSHGSSSAAMGSTSALVARPWGIIEKYLEVLHDPAEVAAVARVMDLILSRLPPTMSEAKRLLPRCRNLCNRRMEGKVYKRLKRTTDFLLLEWFLPGSTAVMRNLMQHTVFLFPPLNRSKVLLHIAIRRHNRLNSSWLCTTLLAQNLKVRIQTLRKLLSNKFSPLRQLPPSAKKLTNLFLGI